MEIDKTNLNAEKWSRRSLNYDNRKFGYFRYMQKKTIYATGLKEGDIFLDIGCGTGWAVLYASTIVKESGFCYGIDISHAMIEKANEKAGNYKNVKFQEAGSENLPFEDNFFNTIICTNSFHHYPHPEKAVIEMNRVLKNYGRVYIADVTADSFITRWADRYTAKKEKEHVKFYSTDEFSLFFNNAGLYYLESRRLTGPIKIHTGEKR